MSTLKVNPVMYLLVERGNPMSAGKLAAQVAHAAVSAYCESPDDRLKHIWEYCGGHYAKVVLECDDLVIAQEYIEARGFVTCMVIDEGRTEFGNTLTRTALGVQIVDKNRADVAATFGEFKLYSGRPRTPEFVIVEGNASPYTVETIRGMLRDGKSPAEVSAWYRAEMTQTLGEEKLSFIHRCKERLSAQRFRRSSRSS